ncbi:complement factor H-related protein 3-like [Siniperca chuatsi]|uniref:complement factor H-related protein 3-like n=1 Tax=Siniperca chuatsi TaxID=119488 RepID=UPI001CE1970E|nr:complement factor H-related protein 3-like [Siniperca chuatsi]
MRFSLLICLFVLWLNMDISLSQNEPAGCGSPPPLTDGDLKYTMKSQYSHNERVEYVCQKYYTMEGEPYRTCINGEWIRQLRCLKPCTVNEDHMRQHNIAFKYKDYKKLYSSHNDVIEFKCTKGRSVDTMRQRCNDGVILLPLCQ